MAKFGGGNLLHSAEDPRRAGGRAGPSGRCATGVAASAPLPQGGVSTSPTPDAVYNRHRPGAAVNTNAHGVRALAVGVPRSASLLELPRGRRRRQRRTVGRPTTRRVGASPCEAWPTAEFRRRPSTTTSTAPRAWGLFHRGCATKNAWLRQAAEVYEMKQGAASGWWRIRRSHVDEGVWIGASWPPVGSACEPAEQGASTPEDQDKLLGYLSCAGARGGARRAQMGRRQTPLRDDVWPVPRPPPPIAVEDTPRRGERWWSGRA